MALDDTDSRTQTALGVVNLYSGDHEQSRFCLQRALHLNPSDTHALIYLSRLDVFEGRPDSAIDRVNEALRLNPYGKYNWSLVPAYFAARRYDEAIQVMRSIQNPAPVMLCWFAAIYAHAGDDRNAQAAAELFMRRASEKLASRGTPLPENWIDFILLRYPTNLPEEKRHFEEGLLKAKFAA